MKIVSINNKKQQEFGMLEFYHVRNGKSKYADKVEEVIDFLRSKKVALKLVDFDLGRRVVTSTPEKETLLQKVLEGFAVRPNFVKTTINYGLLRSDAPNIKLSESVLANLKNDPLQALKIHFDTVG